MYGNLVQIKSNYYGKDSETLVVPLKNLGQVQHMNKQENEAKETF